jgi:4-hydroxybutyrate CoA-transferase
VGAIDGSRKTVMPGRIVCTFGAGTKALYDFVHDNPLVSFRACDFTDDPRVIGQNDNVVAINSALQIALTGQVDADSIGVHVFSRIGGQVNSIRGASRSRGGEADPRDSEHGDKRQDEPHRPDAHPGLAS